MSFPENNDGRPKNGLMKLVKHEPERRPVKVVLSIAFKEHVPERSITSMLTALQASGSVTRISAQQFEVEVGRQARLDALKQQLVKWDQHGYITWAEGLSNA